MLHLPGVLLLLLANRELSRGQVQRVWPRGSAPSQRTVRPQGGPDLRASAWWTPPRSPWGLGGHPSPAFLHVRVYAGSPCRGQGPARPGWPGWEFLYSIPARGCCRGP